MSDQVGNHNVGFLTTRLMLSLHFLHMEMYDTCHGQSNKCKYVYNVVYVHIGVFVEQEYYPNA